MQNEDNACIKYLMKEMDPSEAVLMERRMMEDEDLLIEVECLRKQLKRLDELPEINPPAELTNHIVNQACEYRSRGAGFIPTFTHSSYTKYYAAAAILAVGVTFGVLSLEEQSYSGSQTVQTEHVGAAGMGSGAARTISAENADVKPWVDRNQVLHIGQGSGESASFIDSALQQSMKKLKPIDVPVNFYVNPNRDLQLTGTRH